MKAKLLTNSNPVIAVYLNQNENFLYSHTIHGNFDNPRGMAAKSKLPPFRCFFHEWE